MKIFIFVFTVRHQIPEHAASVLTSDGVINVLSQEVDHRIDYPSLYRKFLISLCV